MNLFLVTFGCILGVLVTGLVMAFGWALCNMAAEADPESDEYKPMIKVVDK